MAGEGVLKELAGGLNKAGILVAADIDEKRLEGVEIELVISKVISRHKSGHLSIVNDQDIANIIGELELEKAPMPIEISRSADFKPQAREFDAQYSMKAGTVDRSEGTVADFVSYFRNRLERLRKVLEERSIAGLMRDLSVLSHYPNGREVTVIGIVKEKFTTKKGNIMVVIEDEVAESKIIFSNFPGTSKSLFESSQSFITDEVIAVKGKIANQFVIANQILWPDVPIKTRKLSKEDVSVALISDLQVGNKLFMEKNFTEFISWLNGGRDYMKDLAGKVKYVVIDGDIADGIGIYPNQDKDLAILDVYTQYKLFFNMISAIPDYIHIFILPGNHDAVQRAEPQPALGADLIGDFKRENVHFLPNPSFITLHGTEILAYHGTSLDSIIAAIPGMSYSAPEKAMVELLKRRHLSPLYGGNIVVPSKSDNLVIDKVPDILQMGHVHKNGIAEYHGVSVVNSGTWQGRTAYQVLQGHIPTPCIVPVYNMKTGGFTNLDFNRVQ